MNKIAVNLIAQRRKQGEAQERLRILSVRLAIGLSVFTVIGALAIVVLLRDTSYTTLLRQKDAATTAIMLLKDKASTMYTLKQRIGVIQKVLAARKTYDTILTMSLAGLGSDAKVESYVITTKTISITASSTSLVTLRSWLDTLQAQVSAKSGFSKISIDNFILDNKQNVYSLSVTLTYL